ncbi:MAG TPA: penicillin acylase family protein [Bryobacteraceae bacterium]|nr:penicillin acylase family protein [Bryobacteraceae bacterium]
MLFTTPLLRAVNLSIAVLLATLAVAVYWFAWRPMPETSGTIAAPIASRATVVRDAQGVPHIEAASWQDAVFLQGFVTAQDRLWQLDFLRRVAAGELAEVAGPLALDQDREARRKRIGRIADQLTPSLPPEARAVLAAYARGVNYFLETHRGRLPLEFTLLNYEPRPWRPRDTVLIALEMHRMLTDTWRNQIRKAHMLEKGDPAKVAFLFPGRTGGEVMPGSNAWVISGAHTADGKPILSNDPHLEYTLPGLWYLVHLQDSPDPNAGLNVTGASIPGVPGVILGHNTRIAWGITNLEFSQQDLYSEQIDAQTGRYMYRGQVEAGRLEREIIAVKGQRNVEQFQLVTRHGPVFLNDEDHTYTLRWTAAELPAFDFSVLDLNRAHNWDEFNAALRRFPGPAQNFLYADVDGNIGYHAAGPVPKRRPTPGCAGDVPVDGTTDDCEWDGFIPYDQLPHAFNPAGGIIASANQNPFPADSPYPVSGNFAPPYRVRQIRARLESREHWKPEEMIAVQKDVYSVFLHSLSQQIVDAWDREPGSNPQMREAVNLLRNWNGQMENGQAAPMLASLAYEELRKSVAERAAPGGADEYQTQRAPEAIERLLRTRPPDWFDDYDQLLVQSLSHALAAGETAQGSRPSRWDWGQYNRLRISNLIVGQIPLLGAYFNIGPVPMSGSPLSVKQVTPRVVPSMRMAVDLGNLDASRISLILGQSGQALSPHYKDQWDAYYNGASFPMQFGKIEAKETLVVNPAR